MLARSDDRVVLVSAPLDGRTFVAVETSGPGDVDSATVFRYHERDGAVWADYAGGAVRRGYLVGTRDGDRLDFRYVHLDTAGATASGRCTSRIEALPDGRVRMHETWAWESRSGSGTSVVESA